MNTGKEVCSASFSSIFLLIHSIRTEQNSLFIIIQNKTLGIYSPSDIQV